MARRDLSSPSGVALTQHPLYVRWAPKWTTLLDVYEGAGGFIEDSKPYLAPHPREWLDHSVKDDQNRTIVNPTPTQASPKLKARRSIARYENVAATLLDQLRAALFRTPPTRSFADPEKIAHDHPLWAFWADADGKGRSIDAVIQEAWTVAGVFGHTILYADRAGETGDNPSQADAPPVILCGYTPLDMPDWLIDEYGTLTQVRLLEAEPRESFETQQTSSGYRVRTITDTTWRVDSVVKPGQKGQPLDKAKAADQGDHGFGALPVVLLYARRRALTPVIGRSVLGDPQLYIDHYNLISEVRELLRNQTFAILNVPIGERTGGAAAEMDLIGQTHGTGNILFSTNAAAYIQPAGENVTVYHEHIDRLLRTIYRLAVVGWESDSRDVETAESRKLKKEDLHQMLAGYAAECEETENAIAQLVYRAHYGPEQWEAQWEKDQPSVAYPDEFDVSGLTEMLEEATAGLALEIGETATKELKKRVAHKLLPGLSEAQQQTIDKEIDALEVKTAAEQEMETLEATFQGQKELAEVKGPAAA